MQTLNQPTTEQTTLPDTELLHVLIAWCYYHQDELKYQFCEYARNTHSQPSTAFGYDHSHRLYSTKADSRVEAAINILLEGGVHYVDLEAGNAWQPGGIVIISGLEEKQYCTRLKPDLPWHGDCQCVDFQKRSFVAGVKCVAYCKHLIVNWFLIEAYKGYLEYAGDKSNQK